MFIFILKNILQEKLTTLQRFPVQACWALGPSRASWPTPAGARHPRRIPLNIFVLLKSLLKNLKMFEASDFYSIRELATWLLKFPVVSSIQSCLAKATTDA